MPHRCMECKNVLESGEMDLTGCPVCGGKKFQYMRPAKKEPRGEKDPRKLTVSEYVDHAASRGQEKVPGHAESPKHKPAKAEAGSAHERIESVRILEKGSYDINLPVLLNRRELVMSREEGVYVVDLPSALKAPKKKKR